MSPEAAPPQPPRPAIGKLTTTGWRVGLAVAVGLAVPTLLVGGPLAAAMGSDEDYPQIIVFVVIAFLDLVILGVIGTPLWVLLHRKRARTRTAALSGAIVGAVIGAILGAAMVFDPNDPVEAPLWFLSPFFAFCAAGISSLTCALMWRVAYPKSLQTPPAESYF